MDEVEVRVGSGMFLQSSLYLQNMTDSDALPTLLSLAIEWTDAEW